MWMNVNLPSVVDHIHASTALVITNVCVQKVIREVGVIA